MKYLLIPIATLCLFTLSVAANSAPSLSENEATTVVDALIQVIQRDYIDPKKADRIEETLKRHLRSDDYQTLTDPQALASRLTRDLLEVTQDLHFHVGLDSEWVEAELQKTEPAVVEAREKKKRAESRQRNFGFREVRRLEGNIGYLNFTYFDDPDLAHDTVAAVMRFLAGSDAVILDLRSNNGGYLEMVQLICSYFLSSVPSKKLLEFYDLEDGRRIERSQWVLPSVTGRRMTDVPLYLLTSSTSFSSAEWLAFVLKNLGRATLIGEQTAGGAHPVNRRVLNNRFFVQVPTGEIRDGVLDQDFEGVGVAPDFEVPAHLALPTAHIEALALLSETRADRRSTYEWLLPLVKSRLEPVQLSQQWQQSLPGHYGSRRILLEDDTLYYSWNGEARIRLLPIGKDLLALEGTDDLRFKIQHNGPSITAVERLFADGRRELMTKTQDH